MDQGLVYRRSLRRLATNPDETVLELPDGRSVGRVAPPVAAWLENCASPATLEDHATDVMRITKLPEARRDTVLAALNELIEQGVFIDHSTLVAEILRARQAETRAQRIDSIVTLTRNRPRALERCIKSYLDHVRAHGRNVCFSVVDSSDQDQKNHAAECLSRLARRERIEIGYADTADKAAFALGLVKESGQSAELVDFALLDVERVGNDTGSNRNALLLAGAGSVFLSVDDDTVCSLSKGLAAHRAELVLTSDADPTGVQLLTARAREDLKTVDACLLELHEKFVGHGVGNCLSNHRADAIAIERLKQGTLEQLLSGRPRVAASFSGLVGDCGAGSPGHHVWRPDVLPQLPLDRAEYARVAAGRQVHRASSVPTIANSTFLMTTSFALNANELVPPFFPVARGQDQLFGATLRNCFPDAFLAYLPWCLTHQPVDGREHTPGTLWGPLNSLTLVEVMKGALRRTTPSLLGTPAARLRALGLGLIELGSLAWAEFEAALSAELMPIAQAKLDDLQRRISRSPGTPWAEDIARYRADFAGMLVKPDFIVPAALRRGRSLEEARGLLQRLIRRFGELCAGWTELFSASQRLAARGTTLFRAIT